jgi:hypothetical protein
MARARMLNLAAVKARLARLPPAIRKATAGAVAKEADGLAEAVRRAAPKGKTGNLAKSVRVEPGDHEGAMRVVVGGPLTTKKIGARTYNRFVAIGSGDTAGRVKTPGGESVVYDYAVGVEHGHRTPDGKHVPAKPFLYPTYRARKKAMSRRIKAAARRAIKSQTAGG